MVREPIGKAVNAFNIHAFQTLKDDIDREAQLSFSIN